jgi:hypothetical protein
MQLVVKSAGSSRSGFCSTLPDNLSICPGTEDSHELHLCKCSGDLVAQYQGLVEVGMTPRRVVVPEGIMSITPRPVYFTSTCDLEQLDFHRGGPAHPFVNRTDLSHFEDREGASYLVHHVLWLITASPQISCI